MNSFLTRELSIYKITQYLNIRKKILCKFVWCLELVFSGSYVEMEENENTWRLYLKKTLKNAQAIVQQTW